MFNDIEEQLNTKKVVIHVQKRNARQCFTIISNMSEELDLNKFCRYFKKTLNCGGNVLQDETFGKVIRLTGDQKQGIIDFFIKEGIYKADEIIIKGI